MCCASARRLLFVIVPVQYMSALRRVLRIVMGSGQEDDRWKLMDQNMRSDSTASDDFGLLTLTAVAKLLHCSKAHVSNDDDG